MKNIFLIFVILVSVLGVSRATTFTVSNTNDTGAGSLRQALLSANADGSANGREPPPDKLFRAQWFNHHGS